MSFQRRQGGSSQQLKGARQGKCVGQSVINSGIPQLDTILGGGIALGSVLLISEDAHNVYAKQIVKAFLAQGIIDEQKLVVIESDHSINLKELPKCVPREQKDTRRIADNSDMKIAFRYERLPQHESLSELESSHILDFSLNIDEQQVLKADITNFTLLDDLPAKILHEIRNILVKQNKVVRIHTTLGTSLLTGSALFLRVLKHLARSYNGVVLVSVPKCCSDKERASLSMIADHVINLTAFSSDERKTNPLYKNHHGLLTIEKLGCINSICSYQPDTLEYTFHQTGKKFQIEMMHLPPDLTEQKTVTMSCATSGGASAKALDF